ncbi:hypothetical protein C8R43DRAFT_1122815 [Mycena crocata]|nr:hypothetical protein C8R43DRAFT_1122815 [Mycena crocata]
MTLCSGCGKNYRWLASSDRCGRCQDRAAHRNSDWTPCTGCGNTFEFLDDNECDVCKERDLAVGHVANCVQNPPNPRQPGQYIPPANPLVTSNPDLLQRAQVALSSLQNAHSTAVSNAVHPGQVARSKVRGAAGTLQSIPRLQVKLSKVLNRNGRAAEKNSGFLASLNDFYQTTPVHDVKSGAVAAIDAYYLKRYGARITMDDVTFQYSNSGTVVNEVHSAGTLGELWNRSTGITVSVKDRKAGVLDLQALVNYPPVFSNEVEDFTSDNSDVYCDTQGKKRKATTVATRSSKRLSSSSFSFVILKYASGAMLVPGGAAMYRSSIQRIDDQFSVSRIDCTLDATGAALWTENSVLTQVSVRQDSSASGKTKRMYMLNWDGQQNAAKTFYDVGGRAPTRDENLSYLKDELRCQKQAAHCLARFQERAKANKISIADLRVAESFIFHVISGPQKHLAWLVDPLLSSTETTKFSGTDVAGNNGDLFGATCDALAHFSLEDSEEYLVFVDIQGIKEPHFIHGIRGADEFVLFDLMQHTRDGGNNLGDKGPMGLEEFKRQHKCNDICKKLPLQPTALASAAPSTAVAQKLAETPPVQIRVRLGSGITDSTANPTGPRTPRGSVRYAGANFNNLLDIDMTETEKIGPFMILEATLSNARKRDSQPAKSVLLYQFSDDKTEDPNIALREVARYADAGELIEEFEALLEEKGFSLGQPEVSDEDSTYYLMLTEFNILQASTPKENKQTWFYTETDPRASTFTDTEASPNSPEERKFNMLVDAFSHFVYVQSGGTYIYDRFLYAWINSTPAVLYFHSSSTTGGTCHNDGGYLGIEDFKIRHECSTVCQCLALPALPA